MEKASEILKTLIFGICSNFCRSQNELRNQGRAQLKQLEKMSQASHFALVACSGYTQCLGLLWNSYNSLSLKHSSKIIIIFMSAFFFKSQQVCPEYDQAVAVSGPMHGLLLALFCSPLHRPQALVHVPKDTQTHANTKEYAQVAHAQTLAGSSR